MELEAAQEEATAIDTFDRIMWYWPGFPGGAYNPCS